MSGDVSPPHSPPLQEKTEDARWLLIHSRIINDSFLLTFDTADLAAARLAHPGVPIYFPAEIDELTRANTPALTLRAVHLAKKVLGAWVVPMEMIKP